MERRENKFLICVEKSDRAYIKYMNYSTKEMKIKKLNKKPACQAMKIFPC
jgi:hypothetical protein